MGLLGAIGFSLALVSLIQIPHSAEGCKILSAEASGPSSILVKWDVHPGATHYFLDLRVINNTHSSPVVLSVRGSITKKNVKGLQPGTKYRVTLKVFSFYYLACTTTIEASTVPATSEIVVHRALSSTSLMVKWTEVPSAMNYFLVVRFKADGHVHVNATYTNTTAVVKGLQPSSNYDCSVYTVNQAGAGSQSRVKTITTLQHPPIGVAATQTGLSTARVTWQPMDGIPMYQVIIRDIADANSQSTMYNVTGTRLDVQGILPCSTYLISVSSYNNFLVPSEPTDYTYTTNKLKAVSSVSVAYSCTNHSAMVHWTAVFGANNYKAEARGANGTLLTCTSTQTSCEITGLSCGQSYEVHVTPMSESCKQMVNTTWATFQTVPCPPQNLTLSRQCVSNVIIFSWDHTNNTDHYVARAVDNKGVAQACMTVDNSCYFTNTICGRLYSFTVHSLSGSSCSSDISSTVDIRTAPCVPQNLQTSADCGSDVLLSKWDLAEGALRYTVEAFGNRGERAKYNCSTFSNSCAIPGVPCGDFLTTFITAFDDECSSPRTLGPVAETVPCPTHSISAVKDCGADSITLTWATNGSEFFFVAMARDINGLIHSSNSLSWSSQIKGLRCGTNYTVYVIASNFNCNSTESEMVTIETAACPPNNITSALDCENNEALISWDGHMNSYTATMVDEEAGLLSCSSTNTSCRIPNLKCGQNYTVTVRYHDGICPGLRSEASYIDSVACGPQVDADFDCQSQVLTIGWNVSSNPQEYRTELSVGSNTSIYTSPAPPLRINTQECGVDHTLHVRALNNGCPSRPTVLPVWKIPCVPTNVVATTNCGQSFVQLTWRASSGALSYQAFAEDKDGQRLLCSSNDTSCRLEGLMCSQVYRLQVAARGNDCVSNASSAEMLLTGPCPPSQLNVTVNCEDDSATLTWSSSPNAVSYTGKAVSADGHTVTCDAGMNLGCQLDDLDCGKEYNFTVSASNGHCESVDSKSVTRTTAPCAVEDVVNSLNCSTNTLTVSWVPGPMQNLYNAIAQPLNGTSIICDTQGSSCSMTLECGEQYTVTVVALSTCTGHSSVPEIVNSVPCVPVNVRGSVECSTNTLQASWDAAAGATSYISTLNEAGSDSSSRPTADQSCLFPDLQCAKTFMFSVVAVNDRCNSSASEVISATTAPCDPTDVSAALNCLSGVVNVTWGASFGAIYYTALTENNGFIHSCNSTGTSCELTQMRCGEQNIVTVLAGDGICNSSILAQTNVTTAPCAPVILDDSLDCVTNHFTVTWVEDEFAVSVTVNATSSTGHRSSCSSSTNSSCVLDGLLCGNTYTARAVAQGVQCLSKPSAPFQIVTAPCTPGNVGYTYDCATGIAFLSWDETLGRSSFYASVHSGDNMASCSTSQTDCSLPSLLCGHVYDVLVLAVADHCNSSVPGVTHIQTAPCHPQNVSASLICENNTAAVSWAASAGAVSYEVMASGRDGDIKQCTSNGTSCNLPNMHCAETYVITVTPFSQRCKGFVSYPHTYIAGPCPPTNVQVSLQCIGNVANVTWTAALQADLYVATATRSAVGVPNTNCTSNGTSCSFTDLGCGETAVVTVVTLERGCVSQPSPPVPFQSVICPPTTVTGVTTCANNDITVSWDPSPESGAHYYVHSQVDGGASANTSTAQTSHTLTGLQCGQLYTLTVAARDDECTSLLSQPIQTETAPCPPTNLTASAHCGTNLGELVWAASVNAISYTATMTGTHGHVASCSSNATTCGARLDCGRQYTAVVIASSATCNSSTGATLTFNSAPCLPDQVVADLDCDVNSFAVRWRGSIGDLGDYTAMAIGSDDSRETCDSSVTNCTIQSLKCGLNYSIVVTTPSVDCGTINGSDYIMQSAPCKPDSVSVDLQCSTNVALVTWGNSGPDQTQEVHAVYRGVTTTCSSSSSNCTFSTLSCGRSYAISVVGHTEECSSEPALAQTLHTAPCVPDHLVARVDCLTGITAVTWDSASGATSYSVYARGSLGHNAECNSTDTNCNFSNLACGQDYNITVVARHDTCASLVSESILATTGPCPHSGLKTSLVCDTNTALVSWTPGSGIRYYNASAVAFDVIHQQTCSTNESSCNISSLRCGEKYKVSVSGQGQNCQSPAVDFYRINTAPCAPSHLMVNTSCQSNNISVSWQPSQGSFSYMAVAENTAGLHWSCNSSSTACQISALPCGQTFQVYSVGLDGTCIGAKSNIQMIHTAPCVPHDIHNHLQCLSGVLNVTWQSTAHVVRFRTSVVSSEGEVSVCETNRHHCVVPNMQCGLTYDVTVVAQDDACNSSHSATKQVVTAPCPLPTFVTSLNCTTGLVSVNWNNSVAGVVYTVSAGDSTGHKHNCSGTTSGCDLSTLACGTKYNVTITPAMNGCVGRDSPVQVITTVPCVPVLSDVEIDCLTNSAWLMYHKSAGAEDYVVMATDSQGAVQTFECNSTSEEMCTLPPLTCSQNLSFTLKAHNQQCSSAPSNVITTETAPCPPENVTQTVDCDNHTISIAWSAVPGAVTYTATMEQGQGHSFCCSSPGTSCDISNVPCGELYYLLVVAEGRTCNSSESERAIVKTVPCVPQDLEPSLSCSDNVASMSWNSSSGGQRYQVRAEGSDGHVDMCSSLGNQCDLTALRCGQHYTATVLSQDMFCKSKPSDSVTIRTAPCTPENVTSVMDCEANTLITSWSESLGADSYLATVQDSNGQTTSCLGTTEGSCNVTGVGCGQIYHVSVVSSDGYCDSPSTPVVNTPSAPCKATNIVAQMDCHQRVAEVTWYPSDGASMYVVTATTLSGPSVTCESNATLCVLEGMLCGHSYSVSLRAVGQTCSSVTLMPGQLDTEPCIPEGIETTYNDGIGQVTWDMSTAADSYSVEGLTEEGLRVSCLTNDSNCALYNMKCGQTYNISVTANNHVCQGASTSNEAVTIMTEPCRPQNVQTSVHCQNDTGTVSWETSAGAVGYKAHLAGRDGHSLYCYTDQTFCDIEGLHCGTVYYAVVIAIGETLNSSSSETAVMQSAPCGLGNVAATYDCENNTAEVSWSLASGASSYLVTAVAADGYRASCESNGHWCNLTELQCGQMYNVSLTVISDHCQIEMSTNTSFSTRPCKPVRVGVDLQCGTRTANMYWEEEEGVDRYIATATSSTGTTRQCNSNSSSCQFSNLHCGETYQFSVTAHSYTCYSELSSTVEVQTEPCQPTDLKVNGSCSNDTVMVDWSEAEGASVYVVTASGNLGYFTTFQTNDTSIEVELLCGQLFTFTVISKDDRCDSPVSLPKEFKTGPCVPRHVQSYTHCEDSIGAVSWAESDGAEMYLAFAVGQDGHSHMCTSNSTSCVWDDLHCGEQYDVHVLADDDQCTSPPSNSTSIRMAPCIPENVQSSINCSMKVGSVTWSASESAEFYTVTAQTNSGHRLQISTNDTWTFFSEFLCGQNYFLSVQAVDSECTSRPSQPSQLKSEPCPPTGVSSSMNCVSNIAVVSWTPSAGADYYTATVTLEDGQSNTCMTDSDDECGMPNLSCGQNFTVTVVASNANCPSDPSEADSLLSVPCVPADVDVKINCSTNQAVVSWGSSEGAIYYEVLARSTQGDMSFCQSTDLMCTLTNLTCGQAYFVQVVALNDICSSLPSLAKDFKSVPCTPDIGSVVLDCYTNSALLDWAWAEGAVNYMATAQCAGGHVSTCSSESNITNCELKELHCGRTYNVTTVASNEICSSPPSSMLQVESVPCPPEDVSPVLDCSNNTAVVQWQASAGADSYIVQAFGIEESIAGCETDSDSCVLEDLLCGFTYNISVIAINSKCNVSQSDITQLQAVPCVPQQVHVHVNCETDAVAVSWEPSKGALSYVTVAQGNGGFEAICNSNQPTCQFNDLLCGHNYSITVSASDETCSSAESSAVEINTAPCVPMGVSAETVCSNDTGVVSWEEGEGVSSYSVQAVGPDGHQIECNSTETSCQLPMMHCGQLYNLTVTARDDRCDSNAYLNLQSVPCSPTYVQASLLCDSNSAAVTWERASGALSYLAVGVSEDGSHRTQCNNTMTFCDLTDLQCGQTYNVSVFSSDENCSSVESETAYMRTAPCAPQDVVVTSECADGAMLVSWSPNPDAQYFHVSAVSDKAERLYCNSSDTSCTISDLPCGQSYSVTVLSVRDDCESKPSAVLQTSSAPCVPTNTTAYLDCVSNSIYAVWETSEGALGYLVVAQGTGGGHNSSCTLPPCEVAELNCGTLYTLHVNAFNDHCYSNDSNIFEIETGPCALASISAEAQCDSDTVHVEWELMGNAPLYVVTAEGHDHTYAYCNSSSNSCDLEDLSCGMHYSIIVSTSSDKCNSLRSQPKKIATAPCVPDNVTAVPSCEESGATVSWGHSPVATSYQLTARGSDGHVASCNPSVNNCTLADLHCGQLYSLSITTSGDNCTSQPSNSSFRTVPCEPSSLAVGLHCETNSATLSWAASEGALEYYGCARSMAGEELYCDSAVSSCTIQGLECGHTYNFSVEASNGICNSSFSAPVQGGAAPCPPTGLKVRMQQMDPVWKNHWAMISWDSATCPDVEYLVEISGRIDNDPQALMVVSSYWQSRPYFEFPMPCSTAYNLTVRAKNSAGTSGPSSLFTGVTVPCAPQNARIVVSRFSVVSWDASVLATTYTVYNVSGGERMELCSTASLSCTLTEFDPETSQLTASNAAGESIPQQIFSGGNRRKRDLNQVNSHVDKGLEIPEVLNVTVSGDSVYVKWTTVKDAAGYTLVFEEESSGQLANPPPTVRTVESDFYIETDLKPWTTYCIRLAAKNTMDQSNYTRPMCRTTGAS